MIRSNKRFAVFDERRKTDRLQRASSFVLRPSSEELTPLRGRFSGTNGLSGISGSTAPQLGLMSDLITEGPRGRLNQIEMLAQEGDVARMAKLFMITGAHSNGNHRVAALPRAR